MEGFVQQEECGGSVRSDCIPAALLWESYALLPAWGTASSTGPGISLLQALNPFFWVGLDYSHTNGFCHQERREMATSTSEIKVLIVMAPVNMRLLCPPLCSVSLVSQPWAVLGARIKISTQ